MESRKNHEKSKSTMALTAEARVYPRAQHSPSMAAIPSSSLQFPNSLALASNSKPHKPKTLTFVIRAADPESPAADSEPRSDGDDFEDRLARLQLRRGTGKKAEIRKARKSRKGSTAAASSVYLPPVPLKEAVSGGLKVEFGFSPYSERINGWIAILGLWALVLVELATGKGVINYHTPAIILIQAYFVAAAAAIIVYLIIKLHEYLASELN